MYRYLRDGLVLLVCAGFCLLAGCVGKPAAQQEKAAGKPQLSETNDGGTDQEAPEQDASKETHEAPGSQNGAAARAVPAPEDPRARMPSDYGGEPIVPLGWSPEGTFAYLVVEEEIGRGGFSVHLGLQTVSDPFEYSESVFYYDVEAFRALEMTSDLPQIVEAAVELWHELLVESGVSVHREVVLEPNRFPYQRDNVGYLPDFTIARSGEESPYDTIAAYDVVMRTTDGRHKLVFTREPSATQVEGGWYYQAPIDRVVAMVILERRQVFGENRMNAHPAVAVIDLSSGFESND